MSIESYNLITIVGCLFVLSGCGNIPLATNIQHPEKTKDQMQLDILVCKDQAQMSLTDANNQAADFILGATIIGAPVAYERDKDTERRVFASCMRERGYTLTEASDNTATSQEANPITQYPAKQEETKEQIEKMRALLRNLKPAKLVPLSQQLTMSEKDALNKQLGECWSVLAGARMAENLVVDVKLTMNPDRTVQDATVLDQVRYASDSYFQSAADSALRAVRNPHCNPLNLPPDKYEGWKVFTVTFDPKQML